jgi:alkylhydroperoxidase family enzyme
MLNWIINRQLDSLERSLGASVDYLRHLARMSNSAFFKFMGFVPMAAHHGGTPRRMLFAARFLATQREDCGTCVQIVVNQAIRENVSVEIIQALIDDDPSGLDQETRLVVEFTRAVLDNTDDQERLREELRASTGERAIVDLSLAIASARVFPMLKRSLGYAVSCQKVNLRIPQLAGADVS